MRSHLAMLAQGAPDDDPLDLLGSLAWPGALVAIAFIGLVAFVSWLLLR